MPLSSSDCVLVQVWCGSTTILVCDETVYLTVTLHEDSPKASCPTVVVVNHWLLYTLDPSSKGEIKNVNQDS